MDDERGGDRPHSGRLSRRSFLAATVAAALAACTDDGAPVAGASSTVPSTATTGPTQTSTTSGVPAPDTTLPAGPAFATDPFTLGVSSGDPTDVAVVLWTRLLPEDGAPAEEVPVAWEVATDEQFGNVIAGGRAVATAALGHSVHVDATGLRPDATYWYRFHAGGHTSPAGRTRTCPAVGTEPSRAMRFALASCQNWERGHWAAWRDVVEQDVDLVVFLGDYIYEGAATTTPEIPDRVHAGGELRTLDDYRARYAQYRSDPLLRGAHAHCPWIVTWDDHEVDNDYAGDAAQDGEPVDAFRERRAAAYQAWYEHMPVRLEPPDGPEYPIHRTVRFGDLLHFWVLDTRQYRDDQVTEAADGVPDLPGTEALTAQGPATLDPARTILGDGQRSWLLDGIRSSRATWTVLAQQVFMFGASLLPGSDPPLVAADTWDGYPADRERVLGAVAENPGTSCVVVTGDFHAAAVADLKPRPFDPGSPVVGTELMTSGISSDFPRQAAGLATAAMLANPHVRSFDPRRGYTLCEVDAAGWLATCRVVADHTDPTSPVRTASRWRITAGMPGATGD